MELCNICPRNCFKDRKNNIGFCGEGEKIKIAKADLHYWEEPCISGQSGSGTIFFSGCSLGCCFCQNSILSHKNFGKEISSERLYEIFFELQDTGAHNINLVTADHFLPAIIPIIKKAKKAGLYIPVVLNTSSYLKPEILNKLEGIVDIYLADFKFFKNELANKYANAKNYPDIAKQAIDIMYSQVGNSVLKGDVMSKGLIVRVLVLPGNVIDAKLIIKYLLDKYSDNIHISIMNQFTPVTNSKYPELTRTLTESEYKSVIDFAISHGFSKGFIQEKGTQIKDFIPDFDLKGV